MSDLISRSALIEKLEKSIKWCEDNLESSTASFQSGCIAAIKDVIGTVKMEETCPSIDAEPVRRGHWVKPTVIDGRAFNIPHCFVCNGVPCGVDEHTNYCPNCGAKMEEAEAKKTV